MTTAKKGPPPYIVPGWVLEQQLNHCAFRVLACLHHHARGKASCYPNAETIGAKCQMKRTTVFASLRELEGLGLIRREKRGRGNSNLYRLIVPNKVPVDTYPPGHPEPSPSGHLEPVPPHDDWSYPFDDREREEDKERPDGTLSEVSQDIPDSRTTETLEQLAVSCGIPPNEIGDSLLKRLRKALATIRESSPQVSTEEIKHRAENYKTHYPDVALSPEALAKHWSTCHERSYRRVKGRVSWA